MHRRFVMSTWKCVGFLVLQAAALPHLASAKPPEPVFSRLARDQGLSDQTVEAITEDHLGFMWFGTQDGLNRYDGYTFTVYRHDPRDPSSLPQSYIWSLLEDSENVLWVGTMDGLSRYDRDNDAFINYSSDEDDPTTLSEDTIHSLLEDRSGQLWVGTFSGLNRFDRESDSFIRYSPQESDPRRQLSAAFLRAIHEDRRGDLWIGTEDTGLIRFDPQVGEQAHYLHNPNDPNSLSNNDVWDVHEDRHGVLWIATHGGLNRFNPETQTFTHWRHDVDDPNSLGSDHLDGILEDRQGRLWIGSDGGALNLFDREAETFARYPHNSYVDYSLGSNVVRTIYEDSKGDLWVGTYTGGVGFYNTSNPPFIYRRHRYEDANSLSHDAVLSFFEEHSGVLWIGTEGGLNRLEQRPDQSAESFEHFLHDKKDTSSLSADAVLCVLRDHQGRLWVGTFFGGLNRLEADGTFTNFPGGPDDPSGLASQHVWDALEDSSGRLWFATFSGIHRFDEATETFVRYANDPDDPTSLVSDVANQLYEDREGILWVASFGGLSGLGPSREEFASYKQDQNDPSSLSNNQVVSVLEDHRGRLWVGTQGGGLNLLDRATGRFRAIRQTDGLGSDFIFCAVQGADGNIWLSTQAGLSRFNPETLKISNYDRSDSVLAMPFSTGACLADRDGLLHFGGTRGMVSFDPTQVSDEDHPPPVVLTAFEIFTDPVATGSKELDRHITQAHEIHLQYDQSVFSLRYSALDYRAPERNQYAFQLEPFDKDWRFVGNERVATYTNLDPGEYIFRVKGSSSRGSWNEDGASIRVSIAPPFWKTAWFRALGALALATVALGYVRSQRKELRRERQAAERERKAAERERQTAERERAVNTRLREVDKLKDEFLANTSHELRTPLYGITGLAESLIDGATGELSEETKANLAMIVGSGRRLGQLVNDILDYSLLTHKSLELKRQPVDLRPLVEVVLALQAPLAVGKDLELRNAVGHDLPAVDVDEARLEQILHNLVGNAIKFTNGGYIEVSATARDDWLTVFVEDTGIGIAEDKREQIFGAFEQGDSSIQRIFGGTGLGLTVTHKLVELHGGEIRVDSRLGEGTCFHFTLPISSRQAEPAATTGPSVSRLMRSDPIPTRVDRGSVAAQTLANAAARGPKFSSILVVDDEPVNLQVLSNHLVSAGHEVTLAANGSEALAIAETRELDLVVLDVMMPGMSGYEVCRKLRKRHSLEDLPVIFLTAKNQVSDLVAGLAAGGNDYLAKPIGKDELLARVRTHLELLSVHRRLAAKNAELARFNYTVAHDLKNPLTTITNFLGLVRRDAASGQTEGLERSLNRLDAAASKLRRMLDELFELSRVGIHTNPSEEVAFDDLMRQSLSQLADQLAERGIEVEVATDLPVISGDRARLLEMVRHLLENAVRYLGEQATPRIEVGLRKAETTLEPLTFFIRDNGIGIDPKYHDKIFGLFDRLNPEASDGTGIGLVLVRRIVEVHGGKIWVESQGHGHGSTFCLTLPWSTSERRGLSPTRGPAQKST